VYEVSCGALSFFRGSAPTASGLCPALPTEVCVVLRYDDAKRTSERAHYSPLPKAEPFNLFRF
jgi:hypothetical protein